MKLNKNLQNFLLRLFLPITIGISFLLFTNPASADIYHVYVKGPNGGQVIIDNAPFSTIEPPDGTCGMRWEDPIEWYWAEGDFAEIGVLNISNNGVDTDLIEFSGPLDYGDCGNGLYNFQTPANFTFDVPNSEPPTEAISLVVQHESNNFAYLDSEGNEIEIFQVFPVPYCELFPDICNGTEFDLVSPTVCDISPENCGALVSVVFNLTKPLTLMNSASVQLEFIDELEDTSNLNNIRESLVKAREYVTSANNLTKSYIVQRDRISKLIEDNSDQFKSLSISQIVGNFSSNLQLSTLTGEECQRQITSLIRLIDAQDSINRFRCDLRDALEQCESAGNLLQNAQIQGGILTWALSVELSTDSDN